MDVMQHLNNVSYFRYFEQARISWFESVGVDASSTTEGPVLGSITCRFVVPAVYPADVTITLRCIRIGNASFAFSHEMRDEKDPSVLYAEGEAAMVWIDLATGRSRAIPAQLRCALQD